MENELSNYSEKKVWVNYSIENVKEVYKIINTCSKSNYDYESIGIDDYYKEKLYNMLVTLTSREEDVITERFGLLTGKHASLLELADKNQVTRERIRQIEAKAIAKLVTRINLN